MIKLSPRHKEAIGLIISRKEFPAFVEFLKIWENNIALLEWIRTDSLDPQLSVKKAKFEGKIEAVKELLSLFESLVKEPKEDEEIT